ncbi:PEP-CTERM protein-sorting domain-containing protein [Alteromonadaceae bacterium Bs31]|nr:PEP-CTERM protein-sorting domain-containing protein [Alteromonadaceae bacterium Bs31]
MLRKSLKIAALAFFAPCLANALTADFDLTQPTSVSDADGWGGMVELIDKIFLGDVYGSEYVYSYASSGSADLGLSVVGFTSYSNSITPVDVGQWGGGLGAEFALGGGEHAIDNNEQRWSGNAYDMLLLSFTEAVSLDAISSGWRGADRGDSTVDASNSESSILAYTGSATPDSFVGGSWNTLGSSWTGIGNYQIDNLNSPEAVNEGGLLSQYWLVGAYNSTLTGITDEQGVSFTDGNDFWKLDGISVSVNPVPLPGTLVLFGTALLAAGSIRKKTKK